jgi:DNA-binding NarL/FixJ family response regulator
MANVEILNSPARTLVVDDYDPWRGHICVELKARPELQVVGMASDGLEAVRMCEELKPDLILLDIGLSSLNGIEVGKRICQLVPNAKVLFLSQNNDAEVVQAALGNGAHGYVLKADAGSELLPSIKAILRGERLSVATPTQQQRQPFVVSPQMNKLLLLTFNIALFC